ncbi:DUF3157 family protein [Vibrio anguillarum]|uniref:DUF3157 family protein n=1 Tax=Vibrio anguillarum TaxID=55601 RepID=UPI00097E3835|nr:DUF3157 family protein [Vibrio anguillarum]MBF4284755.1 DUF3157 family protein [Vibrio anguillarum]MBF4288124.1 DUF3157 family protein [Vibrio anguillarum]MBF4340360.1 DUF3157 family protein [Vibrio anguillarum]MBF4358570.1 DUF3157 family protein [Vibrio anguillarum]MBF4380705.1 DUF3157 family protein [Vibrio anguillarum]
MKTIPVIMMLLSMTASAVSCAQVLTLEDGRQVKLNDDFTWQYVEPQSMSPETVIHAAPIAQKARATTFEMESGKPILQLSDSGVEVVLGAAYYQGDTLVIPTAITNQSSQSVIAVVLSIILYDEQGQPLLTQQLPIWQSIKRMADSYLRPQTQAQGKPITLQVDRQQGYQISANIERVEMR